MDEIKLSKKKKKTQRFHTVLLHLDKILANETNVQWQEAD